MMRAIRKAVGAGFAALAASGFAAAAAEEIPARALFRPALIYPTRCMPPPGAAPVDHRVSVTFDINKEGRPENVFVRTSTDACFEEAAVAAVRATNYEPRKRDGRAVAQPDTETTYVFRFSDQGANEATIAEEVVVQPIVRLPPRYPGNCMDKARPREMVVVEYTVNEKGETEDAKVLESTLSCLNKAAIDSFAKWRYEPPMQNGAPVRREGVQTLVAFELSGWAPQVDYSQTTQIWRRLTRIQRDIQRERAPEISLANLAELERDFGKDFTPDDSAAFYQLRGVARLQAKDYRGALDDLRRTLSLGRTDPKARESIEATVKKLEAYVAAQDAANAAAAQSPPPQQ
jgi:TonB family protein